MSNQLKNSSSYSATGEPECIGSGPDKRVPLCRKCRYKGACASKHADYNSRPTVNFVAQAELLPDNIDLGKKAIADEWDAARVAKFCEKMNRKIDTKMRRFMPRTGDGHLTESGVKFKKDAEDFLSMCEAEVIDPEIWLEAQFTLLSLFLRESPMPIMNGMLFRGKATERYEIFKQRNRRHTHNTKGRNDPTVVNEILSAEIEFGSRIVRDRLEGEEASADALASVVSSRHPKWSFDNPVRRYVAIRAFAAVLDAFLSRASLRVIARSNFTWNEVADFIQQSVE